MAIDSEGVQKLAVGVEYTAKLAEDLLKELKALQKDFTKSQTELEHLKEIVSVLSKIIKDGNSNGELSLLTKMALIEQKLSNIEVSTRGHADLDKRLSKIETFMEEIKEREDDNHRLVMGSVNREIELVHEQKLANTKVREERNVNILKIIAAIVLAILTFAGGYITKTK